jgi:hypothetical protein
LFDHLGSMVTITTARWQSLHGHNS